jgi:GR25 family glycosyltransferase involved in LPS biosynthesis
MKFVYNIFHLDESTHRQKDYENLNTYLSKYFDKLDTPTISISCQEEVDSFLSENPDFKLSGQGTSDMTGTQGWMFGEIGIWASNYFAWKNFLATDADYLILCEDDLVALDKLKDILDIYMAELPEDWDMFTAYVPPAQYGKHNASHEIGAETISKTYQDWSLAFYVINRKSAEKLLQSVYEGVVYPPDWHFFKQPEKFNTYSPKPTEAGLCYLAGTDSTYQLRDTRQTIEGNI